ncbi:MAG: transcriptional repressor LexA, partial [bacterium]
MNKRAVWIRGHHDKKGRRKMSGKELTDRQRAVLEFIEQGILGRGLAPTIREIGQRFAIKSTNGVRQHLNALVRKGYLRKQALISRGLELTRKMPADVSRVPLVGSVPAGLPIDAIENIEGEIAIDESFLPSGDSFTLRVTGDSMKNAGILDGDLILVKKQAEAHKGDIVVAVLNGEATVKRYLPEGKRIRLQPENNDFDPIIVTRSSGDFRIAGKVV